MSRVFKKHIRPEKEVDILDYIECDYCKRKTYSDTVDSAANWASGYEFDQIILRKEEGERYPEGGGCRTEEWDICPKCFEEKVRPILPPSRKHERDW